MIHCLEINRRRAHTSTWFKKKKYIYIYIYIGVCTTLIMFMTNFVNLEINYQHLCLSLSWTC